MTKVNTSGRVNTQVGLHGVQENCYSEFIAHARRNLRVVLALSPIGESFRQRCRAFPSLIACCSIDWFSEWPPEALLSLAQKYLAHVDLGDATQKATLAKACVAVHTAVAPFADRFFRELRRRYTCTIFLMSRAQCEGRSCASLCLWGW